MTPELFVLVWAAVAVVVLAAVRLWLLWPRRPVLDLDGNGVPDWREPWFWRGLWAAVSWTVRTFASPHTLAYRAVTAAEKARAEATAGREA